MEQELKEEGKRAGLQEISERVFRKRYAYSSTETWSECAARVGGFVAKAERDPEVEMKWKEEFSLAIEKLDFLPGGRTLRNASRPHSQMLNCFVLDVEDNIEDIGMLCHDVLVVASGGGGIGVNFSKLRPMGASLRRKGGEASGPCSYMQMIDRIGDTVETGGQRRIALIFILNVNHPEIRDFIHLKEKEGFINNANISVGVTEEFLEAVRLDNDWELTHGGKVYETLQARDLWKEIIHANHNWGDPGIFNISLANKYSNIYYRDELVSPNPCGEIPMAPYDCCCLGSVNLANMVTPPVMQDGDLFQWGRVDWDKLEKTVKMGVRFLDNVLSTNDYPLPRIKETCDQNRRIGLGIMGLHYMLLDLGIKYGDNDRCLKFLDELFRRMKESAYEASADLAAEKKSFPRFRKELVMKSEFIQQLPEWLQDKIARQGLRNCAVLTIAPTGSTAQLPQVSTGLEPIFACAYTRRARLGEGEEEHEDFVVIDPKFREFSDADLPTEHFSTAHDLSVRDHLLVQAAAQRHIDNGISKTVNIPHDYPVEEMEKDMLYFASRIKGSTMWRDGARDIAILKPLDIDEAKRLLGEGNHTIQVHEHDCGVACEI